MEFTYTTILAAELSRRMDANPSYSLRSFARALVIAPSALSEILSGKRIPSKKMSEKIIRSLNLSPLEQTQFMVSVAKSKTELGIKRISPSLRQLLKSPPTMESKNFIDVDLFRVIGDWYHYAILFITETKDFKENPKWIASQLGISEIEVKLAIERLLKLNLLQKKNGKLAIWNKAFTTADKDTSTAALRKHMRQILEKAIFSLENDPMPTRSITAMTMAIDPEKISKAKAMIENFTQELSKYLEGGNKTQVYELNINLFPLQKSRRN